MIEKLLMTRLRSGNIAAVFYYFIRGCIFHTECEMKRLISSTDLIIYLAEFLFTFYKFLYSDFPFQAYTISIYSVIGSVLIYICSYLYNKIISGMIFNNIKYGSW